MPRPPRRSFTLSEQDLALLSKTVRRDDIPAHIRDAALIMLASTETPAFESLAKLLDIDKREVDRVQKAFLAGGVQAVLNLEPRAWDKYKEQLGELRTSLVWDLRKKVSDLDTAPRTQRELADTVGLSKDHVRRIMKKAGVKLPSPFSVERLGKRLRELLNTQPKKHPRWTYREAAEILGVDRVALPRYCKQFGIKFPRKRGLDLKDEIIAILKEEPKQRPFWTFVELGRRLKLSRLQTQKYCIAFGINLPPHPLEARIRAELLTPPREFKKWTYQELAARVGMNRSWVREFCLKKGIDLDDLPASKGSLASDLQIDHTPG